MYALVCMYIWYLWWWYCKTQTNPKRFPTTTTTVLLTTAIYINYYMILARTYIYYLCAIISNVSAASLLHLAWFSCHLPLRIANNSTLNTCTTMFVRVIIIMIIMIQCFAHSLVDQPRAGQSRFVYDMIQFGWFIPSHGPLLFMHWLIHTAAVVVVVVRYAFSLRFRQGFCTYMLLCTV